MFGLLTCALQYLLVFRALVFQASLNFGFSFLSIGDCVTDILLETAEPILSLRLCIAYSILCRRLYVLLNLGCICLGLANNCTDLGLDSADDGI
jgi:hypothetical protein